MDHVELTHSQLALVIERHGFPIVIGDNAPTRDVDALLDQIDRDEDALPHISTDLGDGNRLGLIQLVDPDDCRSIDDLVRQAREYGLPETTLLTMGSGFAALIYKFRSDQLPKCAHWARGIALEDWAYLDLGRDRVLAPGASVNGNSRYVRLSDTPTAELPTVAWDRWVEKPKAEFAPTASRVLGERIFFEHIRDINPELDTDPVIEGLLEKGTLVGLIGQSNVGKTFVAMDMAAHVAAGTDWMGRPTSKGSVAVISVEAPASARRRAFAIRKKLGVAAQGLPFALLPCQLNLGGDSNADARRSVDVLAAVVKDTGQPLQLVVIDNLSSAMTGGDENTSKDMTRFLSDLEYIRDATGACVVIIHHQGKDPTKGGRGHSSFRPKLDTELTVSDGLIKVTKRRDDAYPPPIGFSLVPIEIGRTRSGKPITTCLVEPRCASAEGAFAPKPVPPKAQRALTILQDLGMSGRKVPAEEWRKHFIAAEYAENPGTGRTQFRRAVQTLVDAGRISAEGGCYGAVD